MSGQRENISSDIPVSLRYADDLLSAYGRWAADKPTRHRCGSAEGAYRPGAGEALEQRREGKQWSLRADEAMICQRALARVPDLERVVLVVLYIPRRVPAEAQLRRLHIPPRLARQRHLYGLRMFDNIRHVLELARCENSVRLRAPDAGSAHLEAGRASTAVSESRRSAWVG